MALVAHFQASSCGVSPNFELAFSATKMKCVWEKKKKEEMHLFDFLPCPHPGWLLIKTFLELESETLLVRR